MNTTLVIFAIVAALGLATATATLVVIPNMPQAQARGPPSEPHNPNAISGCGNDGSHGPPFCP
jgi:hypothetical protein